jgi:glutathione S-transferase
MELFASPMACSLASHITALEAGLPVKVRFVDNKKTDAAPETGLAPAWGTVERYQLIDMLNYLSTELHKRIFYNVFNPKSADVTRQAARELVEPTFDYLSTKLGSGDHLVGDRFTVADAYLVTMLNWAVFLKVDLAKWPAIAAYHRKHLQRPSVVQAMGVEMAERQRRAA